MTWKSVITIKKRTYSGFPWKLVGKPCVIVYNLSPKTPLPWHKPGKNESEEMRSVGWMIDNAMGSGGFFVQS